MAIQTVVQFGSEMGSRSGTGSKYSAWGCFAPWPKPANNRGSWRNRPDPPSASVFTIIDDRRVASRLTIPMPMPPLFPDVGGSPVVTVFGKQRWRAWMDQRSKMSQGDPVSKIMNGDRMRVSD